MNKDQVVGTFLGLAIGDALGMPVETLSPQAILEKYPETNGRIDHYLVPTGHKWFDGRKAGTTTDDCQLSLATAEAIIETNSLDITSQVKHHIAAFKESTFGWGGSTREAVRNLINGYIWSKSGCGREGKGKGNGVVMKLAPVILFLKKKLEDCKDEDVRKIILLTSFQFIRDFTIMTHPTKMAVAASFAHAIALLDCLGNNVKGFVKRVVKSSLMGERWAAYLGEETDNITQRLATLDQKYEPGEIISNFGGGSCYLYNCLPFTYGFFLRNPDSIECLYETASAGGDADTNASMIGAMLGARFGVGIFPQHLIDGLEQKDKILDVANRFCEVLGVK